MFSARMLYLYAIWTIIFYDFINAVAYFNGIYSAVGGERMYV